MVSYGLARRTLQPIGEAFEAQGRFTADASHELRTPLTAMQTTIEVGLRDPKLDLTQAKDLLAGTLDEVKKLSALSNGLLKLTRSNTGNIPKDPVSLAGVANQAASQLEPAAQAKSVNIKNEVGDEIVKGDAVSLREVATILLDNAIKYSHEGGTVILSSRVAGKYVYLQVKDEGQGIKASDLVHIFDRFYRADNARSRMGVDGYGLGLPIAKKLIEAHGGSVEASSTPGKGSTFTVKLPLNPNSSAVS
jgi:signal transduction histidine kinase